MSLIDFAAQNILIKLKHSIKETKVVKCFISDDNTNLLKSLLKDPSTFTL